MWRQPSAANAVVGASTRVPIETGAQQAVGAPSGWIPIVTMICALTCPENAVRFLVVLAGSATGLDLPEPPCSIPGLDEFTDCSP